jgi:hypothetical protein
MSAAIYETRMVSFTTTVAIAIGHHDCHFCGVETPAPPDDVLVENAQIAATAGCDQITLWPMDSEASSRFTWTPPGWEIHNHFLTCPGCVAAINAALAERRKNA